MEIIKIAHNFSVCKLASLDGIDFTSPYCFLGITDEEISLVCETEKVPKDTIAREDNWNAFRVSGTLAFSLVGILSSIATILANAHISIFAISTYNTDYVLVKSQDYDKALHHLSVNGYHIK